MSRSKLVREIYAELRRSADDFADVDLLWAASELAEAFAVAEQGQARVMSFRTGGVPFDQWALDSAMADGGWRILRHERELGQCIVDDDADSVTSEIALKDWMLRNAA